MRLALSAFLGLSLWSHPVMAGEPDNEGTLLADAIEARDEISLGEMSSGGIIEFAGADLLDRGIDDVFSTMAGCELFEVDERDTDLWVAKTGWICTDRESVDGPCWDVGFYVYVLQPYALQGDGAPRLGLTSADGYSVERCGEPTVLPPPALPSSEDTQ